MHVAFQTDCDLGDHELGLDSSYNYITFDDGELGLKFYM